MSTDHATRADRRAAYEAATSATDSHTSSCPVCVAGCVCGDADDLMADEHRRVGDLRAVDPYAARAAARAGIPSEG